MRRTKLYPLVALTLSVLPSAAHAQSALADTLAVKPVVMLLVDTSGSMERMPDSSGCVECLPTCTNTAADSTQKNRWAVTLEALTGTFNNFRCVERARSTYTGQYDVGYFLPHYDFTSVSTQASDGVMDSYRSRIKFGLMTFDGVSTTVDGATLVPYMDLITDPTLRPQIVGQAGMWSYPDLTPASISLVVNPSDSNNTPLDVYGWKPLSFKDCTTSVYGVNAGARGKGTLPGSLVSVGASEAGVDIGGVNDSIQTSLLSVRPYAGTPIAAMLDDLRYYLNNDTDVKRGSDPYFTCRKRYAILLTDGAPDNLFRNDTRFQCQSSADSTCAGGACTCPYDTETNLATALITRDGLQQLWLVAFNVNDTVALASLDAIAVAGARAGSGTTQAYRASNMASLRTALSDMLDKATPDATSRSVPSIVNTGAALQLGGAQFEVTAGFKVGTTESDPWEGRLYRQRFGCSGSSSSVLPLDSTAGDMFHVTLNARAGTSRTITTIAPNSGKIAGSLYQGSVPSAPSANDRKPDGTTWTPSYSESDSSSVSAQDTSHGNLGTLATFDHTISTSYFGDADGNGTSGQAADRDLISDYLRGISSNRSAKKLGDIYHSNPTVALPLFPGSDTLNTFDPQLRQFYTDLLNAGATAASNNNKGRYANAYGAGRPGVVYVGSNDGILHAFNLDTWVDKSGTSWGPGYEFWGFVPPALFSKLAATAAPTHQFMFDGTPVVKDMITQRTAAGVTTMKTILLAAVRGAPAFVALDVTFPDQPPVFLWQMSTAYMGNTTGQPALAQAVVNWNGEVQTRAVAILPGGDGILASASACNVNTFGRGAVPNPSTARTQVRCWQRRGRALYVVDVATGTVLQEFDGRHFPSPMNGGVAVDGEGLAQTRAAYMGDQDGVLWRLSMRNPDPTKWVVAPIWDMFAGTATNFSGTAVSAATPAWQAGRSPMYPPLLARDALTGTLNIVAGTGDVDNLSDSAPNRVVSLKETRVINGVELGAGTIAANWNLQLDAGEAVTGPIVMLDGSVYFASFTGPAGGSGDVCLLGTSRLVGGDIRKVDTSGLPLPKLTPESGTGALVLQYKPSTASNSLLLGLSIARDPVCIAGAKQLANPLNPTANRWNQSATGPGGGGAFTLRTMVAGQGGTVMSGSNTTDNGQRQLNITMPITNISRAVGWAGSIE